MKKKTNVLDYDEKVQFIIVGDTSVGKTSILRKYNEGTFQSNYLATVGVDFFTKDIEIGKKIVRLKVWDTAGQERFKSLTNSYIKNAHGIILVYDVSNKDTFNSLKDWINSITEQVGNNNSVKYIILGNKIDLNREVSKETAKKFASENNINYFETSAKDGTNLKEAFMNLIMQTLQHVDLRDSDVSKRFTIDYPKDNNDVSEGESRCKC